MGRALISTEPSAATEPPRGARRRSPASADTASAAGNLARGYIRELDGLRGVAILLVMLHNLWPREGPLARFADVARLGWIGVDLFFVISGFLITGILLDTVAERGYFRNFYLRRALRIFPLYYLFLALVFLVLPRFPDPYLQAVRESGPAWWYLLYLGNLRICMLDSPHAFLGPLWSVAIEEQFYLTLPLAVALLSRKHLWTLLLLVLIAAPVFRWATMLAIPDKPNLQYCLTFCRLDGLALGALFALAFRSPVLDPRGWPAGVTAAVMAGVMVIAGLNGGIGGGGAFSRTLGYSIVAVTFAALLLWTVQHRGGRRVCWLRWTPLCYLGKLCYGLYLFQAPVGDFLDQGARGLGLIPAEHDAVLLLARCAAAVVVAHVSWWVLERNVLRLKKAFDSPRHPIGN